MKSAYHHGDLREQLIESALTIIQESGVEGLSLRKLALQVGVSRTAPYHHFKDKHELLCALVALGFNKLTEQTSEVLAEHKQDLAVQFRRYFDVYIDFAVSNPEVYELMFSRLIWKSEQVSEQLHQVAYPCFTAYVAQVKTWQKQGLLTHDESSLRLTQVSWGMMHGIARLLIDGIYVEEKAISEMCACAVNVLLNKAVQ